VPVASPPNTTAVLPSPTTKARLKLPTASATVDWLALGNTNGVPPTFDPGLGPGLPTAAARLPVG
jgi:hypothetical protein